MTAVDRPQLIAAASALAAMLVAGLAWPEPPESPAPREAGTGQFLTVGDPAPPLDAAHWLRGDEVGSLLPGRIYVIAFWSTWCKYCHASFEALAEAQAAHEDAGVAVLAVSDEKLQTVFEFMARPEWNEQMRFAVATDPDLSIQRDYMEAAAIGEIPTVFLVGPEGVIEWVGHPRKLAEPLEAVLEARWDREDFKEQFEERMAGARARSERMRDMKRTYEAKDWDALLALFDEAIAADPRPAPLKLQRFLLMIGEMGRGPDGYAYGRTLLREFWDDAPRLNQLAWLVVDHESVAARDLDFAMKAAERACDLTRSEDAPILDTLARVYFESGDLATALDLQRKAIEHLDENDPLAPIIQAALTRYEEEQAKREKAGRGG